MTANFYRAFEDRYRGARKLIKARLRVYLPFIRPLAGIHPALPVLDLGCGRGEWLELLRENDITAQGIDLDEGMLAACRERDLCVVSGDAVAHLKQLDDHSLLAVTGFHIAEHLPFALLRALVAEARRVLVPGGLLILETPNPENLVVGTVGFYLDPTHKRPLPSQLLVFMAEYEGFGRVKLMRLQENPRLADENEQVGLYDVLAGVSQDYAIVAQVSAGADPSGDVTQAFLANCGISLSELATRYDEHLRVLLNVERQAVQKVATRAEEAAVRAEEALAVAHQAIGRAGQLAAELHTIYASSSWRITKPLRWLARRFRSGFGGS